MMRATDRMNEAAALWAKGHTAAEIARRLGLASKHAVNQMAYRNRALFPERSAAFRGAHGRAAAQGIVGDWSEADIAKAEEAWRAGSAASEIARLVGRSRSAVLGLMHRCRSRFPMRTTLSTPPEPRPVRVRAKREATPARTKPVEAPAHPTPKAEPARVKAVSRQAVPPVPVEPPAHAEQPAAGGKYRHRDNPVLESRPTPFMALAADQCHWPLVDFDDRSGADMPCCGAKTVRGLYCGPHANRAAGPGTRTERHAERSLLRHGRAK